ncbi:hypothetical protein Q757_04400 [Oenococcus alcoholitolerans]|uniref:Uncharacterized protein n=2 Tax=Oenococcus alcoholitolerans TaxID=931074 RepID=A0ABR4XQY2_9LACO|nr:hypothetical protein Q757_04400 [Oenococcus alcoholitolerans]
MAVVLLLTAYFVYPRASYAGVRMSEKQYKQVQISKKNISKVITSLKRYRPRKPSTVTVLKRDVDKMISENGQNLSSSDFDRLEKAAGDRGNGLLAIVENAQRGSYMIDASVASGLHSNFAVIVLQSARSATESESQAKKVANKIQRDLSIDSRLYSIGSRN